MPADDQPIGFDDFLPHLPEEGIELAASTPLAERLQAYLSSPGDKTRIKLHVEGSGGAGRPAPDPYKPPMR